MPFYKTIPFPGGLIGLWKLSETATDLLPCFSEEELSDPNYLKYTHEKRKTEWLATRILIRKLIGSAFTISYLSSGKPLLKHDKFRHISISHSRHFAAVILHENLNVGIDIEETSRDFTRIEKRYLSEDELLQASKTPRLKCLYWCAKEAIFKLVADEGIDFRKQIHISANEKKSRFSGKFISGEKELNYQLHHKFFAGNCLVWTMGDETHQ